jgi:murein DD-endopeptidase MepM/ murein hydrolase activator NlpD
LKELRRPIQFLIILLFSISITSFNHSDEKGDENSENNEDKPVKKDTAKAVVMYGEELLAPMDEENREEYLSSLLDSLKNTHDAPQELLSHIELLKNIHRKSDEEIILLIDSLFEMEEVPYALINEINIYIANKERFQGSEYDFPGAFFAMPHDTSPYPANVFYGDWNTSLPNPYGHELCKKDTTVVLLLRDNKQNCDFQIPFDGVLTSTFGWRWGKNHNGIDIDVEVWDPIKAAFPGVVRVAKWCGGYGRTVVIRHYNGLETLYAHLHRFKVEPGDIVEAGDIIALGGSSGNSSGSHLHFEMRFKGIPINPLHVLSWKDKDLISDTLILKKTQWSYAAYQPGSVIHTVERGDYLHKIATRYGVSIKEICELNQISRNTTLVVGQKLKIKA